MAGMPSMRTRLHEHLQRVKEDSSLELDRKLLEDCEVLLPPEIGNDLKALRLVVQQASALLFSLQQDPTPLAKLLTTLVKPFSFSDILEQNTPDDFVAGLRVEAQPYNFLVLSLLGKASRNARDAATLAGMPQVVHSVITLWLSTPDMSVAETAGNLIMDLLKVDREPSDVTIHGVGNVVDHCNKGQGLMWRRVFGDKDIYSLFFSMTALKHSKDLRLSKREKTIAQSRVMAIMPRIGLLDWNYAVRSHHADVEGQYGLGTENKGLLDYVALHMVDYKSDVLIYMNLLQFFANLLPLADETLSVKNHELPPLKFLRARGLHERAMSFWLNPNDPTQDPLDVNFLYGPSAHYVATYATHFSEDLTSSSSVHSILTRLCQALDLSANQWAHGQSPKHDLNVLVSLPRVALLRQGLMSPILLLPCKTTNSDVLHALAAIFSGRSVSMNNNEILTFPPQKPDAETDMPDSLQRTNDFSESAAARALFLLYLSHHETLFTHLLTHAELLALPEKALASIALLAALISAHWTALPQTSTSPSSPTAPFALPSGFSIPSSMPSTSLAFLLSPVHQARASVIPWLLRPPHNFSGLVGGRGDAEGAAYQVAVAKWECLLLFRKKLAEAVEWSSDKDEDEGSENARDLLEVVDRRVRDGVWGQRVETGGRVGTMEL